MQTLQPTHPAIKRFADRLKNPKAIANAAAKAYEQWLSRARPKQIRPHVGHPLPEMSTDDWLIWYLDAGRGFGKTAAGANETIRQSEDSPHIAIVAENFSEARDTCIEGESGIKTMLGGDLRWNRSIGEMEFPSGAKGKIYSADDPESLRGPNNYFAWCDEFGKWRYQRETWEQLAFTLRKGRSQCCITTTPRPSPLTKEIKARATTILVKGTSYENLLNLSNAYFSNIIKPYEGTSLGRQELEAADIEDVAGALWTRQLIESTRSLLVPDLKRIVVGVDPAVSAEDGSDETGIVAAGIDDKGHGYVLDDKSLVASPDKWAKEVVAAYSKWQADRIVAEKNNGGDMVETTIRTANAQAPITLVWASRGKRTRAEPISALYEQGKVHHIGTFPTLEDQMCMWLPGSDSPDRMDALVWALTDLMIDELQEVNVDTAPSGLSEYRG